MLVANKKWNLALGIEGDRKKILDVNVGHIRNTSNAKIVIRCEALKKKNKREERDRKVQFDRDRDSMTFFLDADETKFLEGDRE